MHGTGPRNFVSRTGVREAESYFEEEEKGKWPKLKGPWEFCGIGELFLSKELQRHLCMFKKKKKSHSTWD